MVRAYRRAYDVDGGGHYRAQFRITRANDRAERWIEATGRVHFDETGKPVRGVGTLADVTEWRRTHIALRESEERYRALVETGPDAVMVHRGGEIILANRTAAELFGASGPSALVGRSVFDLVMEESLPLARTRTATLTATGDRVGLAHLTYRRVDGSPFFAEAAAACVQLDGQIAVQVVFRDVTERRRRSSHCRRARPSSRPSSILCPSQSGSRTIRRLDASPAIELQRTGCG